MIFRINVDDFGISRGVNSAVDIMAGNGLISSASIMTNGKYFDDAIAIVKRHTNLAIGLHFNLTTGKTALHNHKILTDANGIFHLGFFAIVVKIITNRKQILSEIELELEAQIAELTNAGIKISHIDGHRHIHFIPGIFAIVHKLAVKYEIKTIRLINESLIKSLIQTKDFSFFWNGNLIKWIVLRFFGLINYSSKYKGSEYFFSILYTCKIEGKMLAKMCNKKTACEVMIHPGNSNLDINDDILYEKSHLISKNRDLEAGFILPFLPSA